MKTRGRKSAVSEQTVVVGQFGARAEPPSTLTEAEAAIWRAVVESEPAEFFKTTAQRDILADYCQARAAAALVSSLIAGLSREELEKTEGLKKFRALLKDRAGLNAQAQAAATKLRITSQAR